MHGKLKSAKRLESQSRSDSIIQKYEIRHTLVCRIHRLGYLQDGVGTYVQRHNYIDSGQEMVLL